MKAVERQVGRLVRVLARVAAIECESGTRPLAWARIAVGKAGRLLEDAVGELAAGDGLLGAEVVDDKVEQKGSRPPNG
jgi:hypothetical protein